MCHNPYKIPISINDGWVMVLLVLVVSVAVSGVIWMCFPTPIWRAPVAGDSQGGFWEDLFREDGEWVRENGIVS